MTTTNILSIDVGIKNLAFCLFTLEEEDKSKIKIIKWDIINISEEISFTRKELDKNNLICNKQAKYEKNGQYYCVKHSKKQPYQIPTSDLCSSFINKQKIDDLYKFADKYSITYKKPILKKELVECIQNYIKTTCFQCVIKTDATKVDLISIGRNIKIKLDNIFESNEIDYILIENQISPIANRMKTIQGMIAQYFIMKKTSQYIEFMSSYNKLKNWKNDVVEDEMDIDPEKIEKTEKMLYNERKKQSIRKTTDILLNMNTKEWYDYFIKSKKKDDLADCFLQGLYWLNKNKNSI